MNGYRCRGSIGGEQTGLWMSSPSSSRRPTPWPWLGAPLRPTPSERWRGTSPTGRNWPRPWYTSRGVDLWLPVVGAGHESPREANWLFALGRLAPGVTLEVANAEVEGIGAALARDYPDTNARTDFWVMSLNERMVGGVRRPVLFLAVGAALLLLIAAANAASIFFARATARQSLAAIRASQGASRARLVRQMVTESLVLSVAGGLLGLVVAW